MYAKSNLVWFKQLVHLVLGNVRVIPDDSTDLDWLSRSL